MKVAVTGSSGRIGAACVKELLAHDYEVIGLDRVHGKHRLCETILVDMTQFGDLVQALDGCEAIVHMGAIPCPRFKLPQVVYANNTLSTWNILQAAVTLGIKKVCMASSVNAIGLSYSRKPDFDYFPVDEQHATRAEEPYSLSKWVGEQTGDMFARRYADMTLSSMRYHAVWDTDEKVKTYRKREKIPYKAIFRDLWAYTDMEDAARANRLAIEAEWKGHETFFIVQDDNTQEQTSRALAREFYPHVEIRGELGDYQSLFSNAKAKKLLNWTNLKSWRDY